MQFTTREEILALLGVARESRTLEFKREVHLHKLSDKQEFLRDVTSLANTDGGYLLIGVAEQDGVAEKIVPVSEPQNFRQVALNLLQYSVKPQIFGLRIWAVEIEPGEHVVVVYVPMSWNRPHMVVLKGERGFWGRNEEGKYPLDVATLRALFLWGQGIEERIESFRAERIAWLLERDAKYPYAMLHFVPFSALQPGRTIALNPEVSKFFYNVAGGSFQVNFEGGFVGDLPQEENGHIFYAQIFRSGAIEIGAKLHWEVERQSYLNLGRLDYLMSRRWLPALWDYYKELQEVTPPFAWILTLLNVKALQPLPGTRWNSFSLRPGDRSHLLFPIQVLEEWHTPQDVLGVLIPLFDQVWQAFGASQDPYWMDPETWLDLYRKFQMDELE